MNGTPIHWRSNKQPKTTPSPTESEVYALSVGVKDSRLTGWVMDELGVGVGYPLRVATDSSGAYSFKGDMCPTSKLRGCFDYRAKWVRELVDDKEIELYLVKDEANLADIFTKCHSTKEFRRRRDLILNEFSRRT